MCFRGCRRFATRFCRGFGGMLGEIGVLVWRVIAATTLCALCRRQTACVVLMRNGFYRHP